jgi:septum formation protein
MTPRIVLASASPRRRALLTALGLEVEVAPSTAEEHFDGTPEGMVVSNACLKRDEVAARLEGAPALVIAADTLVFLDGEPLGKPADLDEARAMLRRLSGRTHAVITGVAIFDAATGRTAEGHETTGVTFRDLSEDAIDHFVHAVNPVDRAGAYTVDGPGTLIVARYEGCYQNVLGLPMVRLDALLQSLGHDLLALADPTRAQFL